MTEEGRGELLTPLLPPLLRSNRRLGIRSQNSLAPFSQDMKGHQTMYRIYRFDWTPDGRYNGLKLHKDCSNLREVVQEASVLAHPLYGYGRLTIRLAEEDHADLPINIRLTHNEEGQTVVRHNGRGMFPSWVYEDGLHPHPSLR